MMKNLNGKVTTITINEGASFELTRTDLSNAKVLIKNGGSFYGDSYEDTTTLYKCEFEIESEGVLFTNGKTKIQESSIIIQLENQHVPTFEEVELTKVKLYLRTKHKKVWMLILKKLNI